MLGALCGAALALAGAAAQAQDKIMFVSQGGAYQKAQTIAILDPAAKKLGMTINQDSAPDSWPMMKSQVGSGKITWDVVDVPTSYCLRGGEQGLVEKFDLARMPNVAAMPEAFRSPWSVAYEFYSSVLGYSTRKFPDAAKAPQSWADFWDVKKFPGRRALRNHPLATLEAALMADGVAPDKLYPLDVDRAFRKLAEIKPAITVWWTSGAQSAQLLNDGEVDMVMAWNGRITALLKESAKVGYTFNQGILQSTSLCILKGTPNGEWVRKFIAFAAEAKQQAEWCKHLSYGVTNPNALKLLPPERVKIIGTNPDYAAKALLIDNDFWAANLDTGLTRMKEWFLKA